MALPIRILCLFVFLFSLSALTCALGLAFAAQSPAGAEISLADAKALLDSGKTTEAERATRQFLEGHSDSAEGHFLLGLILFRRIQADAVLQSQLVAQAAGPMANTKTLGALPADANERVELAKASLAEYTAGAKFRDPGAFDLKIVALDYVLLADFPDADKWLTRSLQWNPKDSEAWYYLGRTKYNENRFDEAAQSFQQCLKLDPRNVKSEDNLGLAYQGLGRNEDATAAFKTAMEWQSSSPVKNPGPYINLGSLLIDENRPDDALPFLTEAIAIAPRESRAHELLGKTYSRLEQLPKAQTELEKAIELSPDSANLYCMLAPIYRKEGFGEKAKTEFDRCAALTGTHSVPPTPRQ